MQPEFRLVRPMTSSGALRNYPSKSRAAASGRDKIRLTSLSSSFPHGHIFEVRNSSRRIVGGCSCRHCIPVHTTEDTVESLIKMKLSRSSFCSLILIYIIDSISHALISVNVSKHHACLFQCTVCFKTTICRIVYQLLRFVCTNSVGNQILNQLNSILRYVFLIHGLYIRIKMCVQ